MAEYRESKDEPGKRFDAGKPPLAMLPFPALREIAKVLEYGARIKGYGDWNWRKGTSYSRVLSCTLRHLAAWAERENNDVESGLPHLAHAICDALFLLQYELDGRKDFDDRYRKEPPVK
jgi:hypothetical protein